MNSIKRIVFQLIALAGIIAFFLPWFGNFFGSSSGFEILDHSHLWGIRQTWVLVLFPLSFAISGLAKFNFAQTISPMAIKIIEFIPFLLVLYLTVQFIVELERNGGAPRGFYSDISELFQIGFYLNVLCSILLIFSPLNEKKINS